MSTPRKLGAQTQPEPAPEDLSTMLDRLKGGRSFVMLQDAGGGKPNASRYHQIIRDGKVDAVTGRSALKNDPDPETVMAMAVALGVDPYDLRDAAAISLGYPPRRRRDPLVVARLRAIDQIDVLDRHADLFVAMAAALLSERIE